MTKPFCCGDVYEVYGFSIIFFEGIVTPIRHSMPEYRGGMKRSKPM